MIVHNTNNKIKETLSRLRNNHPVFINSNKNPYVKESDDIEMDFLAWIFKVWTIYLLMKGIMPLEQSRQKNDSSYYLTILHLTTTLIVKTIGQRIVLPQCEHYGSCSIQTMADMLHQVNTWHLVKHYILCNTKLLSVNTILTSLTSMVFY